MIIPTGTRHISTLLQYHNALSDAHCQRPDPLTYAMLGLGGEVGEVIELYKKVMRKVEPALVPHQPERDDLLDELGDVLWYAAKIAKLLGSNIEEVANRNIAKITRRQKEGKK